MRLPGFVLARAAAGLSDGTIRGDESHLEQVRSWFGRPLWEVQAPGCGRLLRHGAARGALGHAFARAQASKTYVEFVELRHAIFAPASSI